MNSEDLKKISILKGLPDATLDSLATALEDRPFHSGERIFDEGDPGDSMFFVLEGAVRIEKKTGLTGPGAKTLAIFATGDYFGEMSLFDQQPRSASAVSVNQTRLLRFSKTAFDSLVTGGGAAGMSVISAMIRTANDRLRRLNLQVVVYDEIGKAIGESKSLQELLDVILCQLCLATLADWGLLLLKSQFSAALELRSVEGLQLSPRQKELITSGKGFFEPFMPDPREMITANFDQDETFKSCSRFGFELPALLLSPITLNQQFLGVIALGDHEIEQFDLNDMNLVRGVARQAGQAILNALHREEEQARSRHSRQFVRF